MTKREIIEQIDPDRRYSSIEIWRIIKQMKPIHHFTILNWLREGKIITEKVPMKTKFSYKTKGNDLIAFITNHL